MNGVENNYKQFQGQEWTEDLNLNVHEFRFRISDPAIGRFWQVDPLAEDYVYNGTYNFAENKVINSRELEGLEAWESTRNWTEKDIKAYGEAVSQRAEEYRQNGTTCTCEDFGLNVLIDYASENGLPINIENGTGSYDSSSLDYDNVGDFRNDVLKTTGARDLQNDSNTTAGDINNLNAGDLLLKRDDGVNANHVQVVSSVDGNKVDIAQGNSGILNGVPGASRILGAGNPKSPFYTGVTPQLGSYDLSTGNYSRTTTTPSYYSTTGNFMVPAKTTTNVTNNAVKSFNLQVRKWNFNNWKK